MDEQRYSWDVGMTVALDVYGLLADCCERLAVGGSLRRGKPDVKDVELVAQPILRDGVNLLHARLDRLERAGHVQKSTKSNGTLKAWGDRYRAFLFAGMGVDVFIVLPDRDWGPTFLIRSGPGEANEALVMRQGGRTRSGVVGVLPDGMKFEDGMLLKEGRVIHCAEEWDVFAACGLPWVAPPKRTAEYYQLLRKIYGVTHGRRWALVDDAAPQDGVDLIWAPEGAACRANGSGARRKIEPSGLLAKRPHIQAMLDEIGDYAPVKML